MNFARGQFNKTFTSVAIVLEPENNSYNCKLPLKNLNYPMEYTVVVTHNV